MASESHRREAPAAGNRHRAGPRTRPEYIAQQRPAAPNHGIARRLRSLIGVSEDILDWAPEERPRYTLLAAIVVNTGILAALSLIIALSSLMHGNWLLLVPFGVLWGMVIMTFDRWVITSTQGASQRSKSAVFGPRLVLSALLGAVIAEPLVLWVFQAPIHNEVAEYRKHQIEQYESLLKECNPVVGGTPPGPRCADYRVNVAHPPEAIEHELAEATAQLDRSTSEVAGIDRRLDELERLARDECAGTSGEGLTGVAGEGGECLRNRQKADQYRLDTQIDKRHADLITLQHKVDDLTRQLGDARTQSGTEIADAISAKVEEKRNNLRDRGILDDIDALNRLSDNSTAVRAATWVLRLLLVAIDCMPVLGKLMSGTTTYDTLVARQLAATNRQHDRHTRLVEREHAVDLEIETQIVEQMLRNNTDDLIDGDRIDRARRKTALHTQIDELAAELERTYRQRHTV
jgi:hypothetical protein